MEFVQKFKLASRLSIITFALVVVVFFFLAAHAAWLHRQLAAAQDRLKAEQTLREEAEELRMENAALRRQLDAQQSGVSQPATP